MKIYMEMTRPGWGGKATADCELDEDLVDLIMSGGDAGNSRQRKVDFIAAELKPYIEGMLDKAEQQGGQWHG